MGKITSYGALASTQPDDLLVIVDVHDTTMAPTGTDKKITVSNLVTAANAGALAAKAGSATVPAAELSPQVVALTDAATIAVNAALGNDMRVTIAASRTMGAPSNPSDGQQLTFLVTQPASGGPCTLTWTGGAGGYDFGSAGAPVLSTTASKTDVIAFKYVASVNSWYCLGSATGF